VRRALLFPLLLTTIAGADASAPEAAPKCHDTTWRGIERAFTGYCKGRTGRGVHGSCADWLRAFRQCNGDFEAARPGWHIVIRLFDCHDPVVEAVPEGKGWRVKDVKMKSYLPTPGFPLRPGSSDFDLELDPSPSPITRAPSSTR
jgi:hypothetical protein